MWMVILDQRMPLFGQSFASALSSATTESSLAIAAPETAPRRYVSYALIRTTSRKAGPSFSTVEVNSSSLSDSILPSVIPLSIRTCHTIIKTIRVNGMKIE
jgi:hypothetical protein